MPVCLVPVWLVPVGLVPVWVVPVWLVPAGLVAALGGFGVWSARRWQGAGGRRESWGWAALAFAAGAAWWLASGVRLGAWPAGGAGRAAVACAALGAAWLTPALVRHGGVLAAVVFMAWYVPGGAVGREEVWRVVFALLAAAWWLARAGAGRGKVAPAGAVALGLVLLGGAWLGGVALEAPGVALGVGLAAALGGAGARRGGVPGEVPGEVPGALLAVGVGVTALSVGRGLGRFGVVEVACLLALAAPRLVAALERGRLRRLRRFAPVGAVLGASSALVAAAWVGARAVRG